jgi:hypothetical protein
LDTIAEGNSSHAEGEGEYYTATFKNFTGGTTMIEVEDDSIPEGRLSDLDSSFVFVKSH